jgi:hypothetical protein
MEWLTRMASLEEGMSTLHTDCDTDSGIIVEDTAQEVVDMEVSTQEEECKM